MSSLDSRGATVKPRPLILGAVLDEIVSESLSPGVNVEFDVPDDLVVDADRLALDRVLSNLLINALRHGAEPITLSAQASGADLRITVEDGGRGVPEELRPRLFERFSRTESANAGSGLGLAIARAYARAHGGDLVHEPGASGARFTLIIPQKPSADQQIRTSRLELTACSPSRRPSERTRADRPRRR